MVVRHNKVPRMFIKMAFCALISLFKSRTRLVLENTMLRHQLGILKRRNTRIYFKGWDRAILVWLSRCLCNWREILFIVQPETLIRWHRKGFSLYWGWKFSSQTGGRNPLHPNAIQLIKEISAANPLWGSPRIHGELLKLGIKVSEATVDKYRVRRRNPRNQNWKTFLRNHMEQTVAIDFFIVPTIRFRMLWALVVLSHDRREILYTAITHKPSQPWVRQQLRQAFPFQSFPRFLIHDRDHAFRGMSEMGFEEVLTGFRCPWQNAFVERVIGSIRRECTDHLIVFGERHLGRILRKYQTYYNKSRTHLSLNKDSPVSREVKNKGRVISRPHLGGLHWEFGRRAA